MNCDNEILWQYYKQYITRETTIIIYANVYTFISFIVRH